VSRARRWLTVFASVLVAAVLLLALALAMIDRWLFVVLAPGAGQPPPPPDYALPAAWAALPEQADDADVAIAELPAADPAAAPADVFYLHPTTWLGDTWNGRTDDPATLAAVARGGTRIQASAFNACGAVYAPRYRQAHGKAFVTSSDDGERAKDLAYADVVAAFAQFQQRRGAQRPFVLAGHSQGSVHAQRLLREVIWPGPARAQLVVAYLIGAPATRASLGAEIPVCGSAEQTGCAVVYNARGPRHRPGPLDFAELQAASSGSGGDPLICVNPLSWREDDVAIPAARHAGAMFLDATVPAVLPRFADARCEGGRLLLRELGPLPWRDLPSWILLWVMGPEQYHPVEYQLFYVNLRRNAQVRVEAWLQRNPGSATAASQPGAP
jgi:hypothetical protein